MTMTQVERLPAEIEASSLSQLLTNSLILCNTTPYLSAYDLLNLAASSRDLRYLIYNTPQVLRRLDLTKVKAAQFDDLLPIDSGGELWRNVQVDEHLTEDDFYSGPLRGIFSSLRRVNLLQDVHTLILDGLSVTAELVHEIISDPSFAIRILSIRAVRNLNQHRLRQTLEYACRPSRTEGMPRLRGIYVFGQESKPEPVTSATSKLLKAPEPEEESWYVRRGSQFPHRKGDIGEDWANTLAACQGIIAFDAIQCGGPRHHYSMSTEHVIPHQGVAAYALDGCANCGAAPEGWTVWGENIADERRDPDGRRGSGNCSSDIGRFPLLWPPPSLSASLKVAMCPTSQRISPRMIDSRDRDQARFIPRCFECLRDRYCGNCNRWWCETCYSGPNAQAGHGTGNDLAGLAKSCWECGVNCRDCINTTQRMCHRCGGGYCLRHNEGSNLIACDWCSARGQHVRELY